MADGTHYSKDSYFFPPQESVRFTPDVLLELTNKTLASPHSEYWVFLLGRGPIIAKTVQVGQPHAKGITVEVDYLATLQNLIAPELQNGLEIVGDYHTHTVDAVSKYVRSGYPPQAATCPSTPDISSSLAEAYQVFGKRWPRIIGAVMPTGEVAISAFDIIKFSEVSQKVKNFEFVDPDLPPMSSPRSAKKGLRLLRSHLTDPLKMINSLYIRPRKLMVDGIYRAPVTLNAIQTAYPGQLPM